jgi:hypothetical protein
VDGFPGIKHVAWQKVSFRWRFKLHLKESHASWKFGEDLKPLLPPIAQTVRAFRRRDKSLLPSAPRRA